MLDYFSGVMLHVDDMLNTFWHLFKDRCFVRFTEAKQVCTRIWQKNIPAGAKISS
jgi:hypothetical protein